MEKPTRGNLFDDDSDEKEDYKPSAPVEESPAATEEPVAEVPAAVEEPAAEVPATIAPKEESDEEYKPTVEAPKEEEAQVVEEPPKVEEPIAVEPEAKVEAAEEEEEYIPQVEEPKPVVVAAKPAPIKAPDAPHIETEAEKKLAVDAKKAEDQFEEMEKLDTNQPIAEDKDTDIAENERSKKFTVQSPQKVSGTVKYTVTGIDDEGEFTETRRFREFHALGVALNTRWPGCYMPSIPEKKVVGKEDEKFIEERRELLNRFMKEISKYEYITNSVEFKTFSRGKGEVDKLLDKLPKQTPMEVLQKFRANFEIDEDQDSAALDGYKDRIMVFQQYLKKAIGIMEMQRKQMKTMEAVRDRQDKSTNELLTHMMKFEETGLEYYSDQDNQKRVLTHPSQEDLKGRVETGTAKLKNPYREAYIWLKGEFMDVNAMYEALQGREGIMKRQIASESKKRTDTAELAKLKDGKKTMKSLFKSKAGKEQSVLNLEAAMEGADQEIADYKKLITFLTIYHGQSSIPAFKAAKSGMYLKTLNSFCVKEISNAHASALLYHSMLDIGGAKDEAKE